MRLLAITQRKQRLDDLFSKVNALSSDVEMQAHWARYLCVLTSGFLENAIRIILSHYCYARADEKVVRFVQKRLTRFQNPNMENILAIVSAFSDEWRKAVEQNAQDEWKDAVNSIVSNRHNIAHGESVGISYSTLKKYYDNAIKMVELLENCTA